MKHIVTIEKPCINASANTGCGECQASCQSACKTSCEGCLCPPVLSYINGQTQRQDAGMPARLLRTMRKKEVPD